MELAIAIAGGASVADAARTAGISESTAFRRLQDTAFRARVDDIRAELLAQAMGMLTDASTKAVTTLVELLKSNRPTVQLGAARAILEAAPKFHEHVDLAARVAAIEERLEGQQAGGRRRWLA